MYMYDETGSPIGIKFRRGDYAENTYDYFFFEKNLQGDIVAIYNENGTKIGSYTYDAWGNVTVTTHTSGIESTIVYNNPFRYRGYYYDLETGWYYLQSRYYNPEWGRFINVDSLMAGTSGTIKGYNMFAYCFNNPVNMTDSLGNWPEWIEDAEKWLKDNVARPVADFIWNVAEDIAKYDSNNQSEEKVFESNYFSNYKGTIVIKTPFDTSFSFGFIVLSIHQQDSDTLKHEYGHALQMKEMGIVRYTTDVAIPSITINFLDRLDKLPYDYYSYPWEAEANKLGGATLSEDDKLPLPQGEYSSYWDLIQLFFK